MSQKRQIVARRDLAAVKFTCPLIACAFICCLVASRAPQCQGHRGSFIDELENLSANGTCTSDDLNHSILVECSAQTCGNPPSSGDGEVVWPASANEIIHVQSTRAGDRFRTMKSPSLFEREDHNTKLLNINTTISVNTSSTTSNPLVFNGGALIGFGATFSANDLALGLKQDLFDRLYCLILDDLFGTSGTSARLSLLRLQVDNGFLSRQYNLSEVLVALDRQPNRHPTSSRARIRILIDFVEQLELSTLKQLLDEVYRLKSYLTNVEIYAVALQFTATLDGAYIDEISRLSSRSLPRNLLIAAFPIDEEFMARKPDGTFVSDDPAKFDGFLVRTKPSIPYDALEQHKTSRWLVALGQLQPKTRDYGNWDNAHQAATQILNQLRHGSMGYIEENSVSDILDSSLDASPQDALLYSLHRNHGLHFKGPKFYALGHFSRYLNAGARSLKLDVFTQPNMFAARYSAFLSADREHVISVVLNDNEHPLPFRLSINNVVRLLVHLQPKSFNTFLIKIYDK